MNSAAIYAVEGVLLVSITEDITDSDIIELQEMLSNRIADNETRGVVVDISALEIVDTFVGRVLAQHFPRAEDDENEIPDRLIEL